MSALAGVSLKVRLEPVPDVSEVTLFPTVNRKIVTLPQTLNRHRFAEMLVNSAFVSKGVALNDP